jgi:hypothetical protein
LRRILPNRSKNEKREEKKGKQRFFSSVGDVCSILKTGPFGGQITLVTRDVAAAASEHLTTRTLPDFSKKFQISEFFSHQRQDANVPQSTDRAGNPGIPYRHPPARHFQIGSNHLLIAVLRHPHAVALSTINHS